MKTIKRFGKFILIPAVFVLALFAFASCANEDEKTEETPREDFTIENNVITGYSGAGGKIKIPSGVTAIGDGAFYFCLSIRGVILPDGVTSIGDKAFFGCNGLQTITLPDTLKSIGEEAFLFCMNVTNMAVPSGVTSIGGCAFGGWPTNRTIRIRSLSGAPEGWSPLWSAYCNSSIIWKA